MGLLLFWGILLSLPCISCDQTFFMGNEKWYVMYKGLLVYQLKAQNSEQKYFHKLFFLNKMRYLRKSPLILPPSCWLKCLTFHQEDLCLFRYINILNCFVAVDHNVQYLSKGDHYWPNLTPDETEEMRVCCPVNYLQSLSSQSFPTVEGQGSACDLLV